MIYPMIRHFSFNVYNINRVVLILKQLGFDKIYGKEENHVKIVKMKSVYYNYTIELLQSFDIVGVYDTGHICFEGGVPDFMKKNKKLYYVEKYDFCADKNREVYFVYIDDYIYFEFSKETNKQ